MPKAVPFAAMIAALIFTPTVVLAVPFFISGDMGTEGLGRFEGTFEYSPGMDETTGTVDISLTNTSNPLNGGFITAFVFNIPTGADVTSATLSSDNDAFDDEATDLLGPLTFDDNVPASPFGDFDIGGSTDGSFLGGGSGAGGIGVNQTANFIFTLSGMGLLNLTTLDFLTTLSNPQGMNPGEVFAVRFQSFENEGSDKVPVDTITEITAPEPTTALLLGFGLLSLSVAGVRSRRKS